MVIGSKVCYITCMNPIGEVISSSRMGTRIPEELLGLPSRSMRYDRTYSMEPVAAVSGLRTNAKTGTEQTAQTGNATAAEQVASGLLGRLTGTADVEAFRDVLLKAIGEQRETTVSPELTSDPEYYRNLMMLSQFSSNLISDNLNTLGVSGASVFGLDALS